MRLDPEYIRSLLKTIEAIDSPRPLIFAVINHHFGCERVPSEIPDEFVLHIEVLEDYGFIEFPLGQTPIKQNGQRLLLSNYPIRLTSQGHEFIHALEKSEVWEIIKKDFRQESVKTIFSVASQLASGYARDKLGKYLD